MAPPRESAALLHASVARGSVVLCDAGDEANFGQATATIVRLALQIPSLWKPEVEQLSKIPPNSSKLTYAADNYLFHYIKDGQSDVVVLVVADDSVGRRMPFAFLSELQKRFLATYSQDQIDDAPAYGLTSFSATIEQLMEQFVNDPTSDPVRQAQAEIANVKDIMVHNVEAILSRGERIELLVDKTDNLSSQAKAFRKRSTQLRRRMWWRNTKLMALTGFVLVLLLYLILASACGASLSRG